MLLISIKKIFKLRLPFLPIVNEMVKTSLSKILFAKSVIVDFG